MRTCIKPCVVSLVLAVQSFALPARSFAAQPPAPIHGEAAEEERDGADDTIMMYDTDTVVTVVLVFLAYGFGIFLGYKANNELMEEKVRLKEEVQDIGDRARDLKVRASYLERENRGLRNIVVWGVPEARDINDALTRLWRESHSLDSPRSDRFGLQGMVRRFKKQQAEPRLLIEARSVCRSPKS